MIINSAQMMIQPYFTGMFHRYRKVSFINISSWTENEIYNWYYFTMIYMIFSHLMKMIVAHDKRCHKFGSVIYRPYKLYTNIISLESDLCINYQSQGHRTNFIMTWKLESWCCLIIFGLGHFFNTLVLLKYLDINKSTIGILWIISNLETKLLIETGNIIPILGNVLFHKDVSQYESNTNDGLLFTLLAALCSL